MGPRVLKVGGSLLDLPDLPGRLQAWLSEHPGEHSGNPELFVAGGGRAVDAVRHWSRTHPISDAAAHQWCIELMGTTGRLLAMLLDLPPIADCVPGAITHRGVFIPDARRPPLDDLPASWDVTSDSIAARLAEHMQASELVLFKSRSSRGGGPAQWQTDQLVDRAFPRYALRLARISIVNLRQDPVRMSTWTA